MPRYDSHPLIWRIGSKESRSPGLGKTSLIEVAAKFLTSARKGEDLQVIRQEACVAACDGLGATFSKLLVYDESEQDFLLRAGTGWPPGIVGHSRLAADMGTAAGFARGTGEPVVSNDDGGGRFRVPASMIERDPCTILDVPIVGCDGTSYGVLDVERPLHNGFVADDVCFLQLIASSLAEASCRLADRSDEVNLRGMDDEDARVSSQELEHRLRNDLQGIQASIEREAGKATDPWHRAGYARLSRQVLAIASLYQHLRVNGSETKVDLGAYVEGLCEKITAAANLAARDITLVVRAAAVHIPPAKAAPLAIAINELVTNAAEHAFPDGQPGAIVLQLAVRPEGDVGRVEVVVSDDGCGYIQGCGGREGLGLVNRLVRSAGGAMTRLKGRGTTWQITLGIDPSRSTQTPSGLAQAGRGSIASQHRETERDGNAGVICDC